MVKTTQMVSFLKRGVCVGGDWHSIHRMKLVNGIELGVEEKIVLI